MNCCTHTTLKGMNIFCNARNNLFLKKTMLLTIQYFGQFSHAPPLSPRKRKLKKPSPVYFPRLRGGLRERIETVEVLINECIAFVRARDLHKKMYYQQVARDIHGQNLSVAQNVVRHTFTFEWRTSPRFCRV